MDLHIRRGVIEDAPALAEFAARTFKETFGEDNEPEDMQAHLEKSYGIPQQTKELLDPGTVTLLAFQNETLLAYAQIRRNAPPSCVTQESPIELHRFYVDRLAHGQGIAQKLMTGVCEAVRELDGQHVWLGVWEKNPRAISFYKKMGFVDMGSTVFYVGPDKQTDRVMVT